MASVKRLKDMEPEGIVPWQVFALLAVISLSVILLVHLLNKVDGTYEEVTDGD